ncbi:MAG: S8 family serine peptidase [Euryarchaeota archaeon]|nr:S8 family serine peptidase [Euryarchaeota archaeon]
MAGTTGEKLKWASGWLEFVQEMPNTVGRAGVAMRAVLWALIIVGPLMAGCVSTDAPVEIQLVPEATTASNLKPVVIAVLDTGVAPYHEIFAQSYDPGRSATVRGLAAQTWGPVPAVDLQIGPGDDGTFTNRLESDKAVWATLRNETLYYFNGTNVFGYSMPSTFNPPFPHSSVSASEQVPVLDEDGHGTVMASIIASAGAIVVAIKIPNAYYENQQEVTRNTARALDWIANQTWIDFVSYSFGVRGNPPTPWDAEMLSGIKNVGAKGKLFFTASGNEPSTVITSGAQGPPEAIAVGAFHNASHGDRPDTGKQMDYVSDYVMWVIDPHSRAGWNWNSGTSLSAPYAAGTAAAILLELRRATPDRSLSAAEIRNALNVSAKYWRASDWQEKITNYSDPGDGVFLGGSAPILPTPWVQMGWGYVGPEIVPAAVAYLKGESTPPPKPAEAIQYMETTYALREAYWAQRGDLAS